MDNVIIKDYPTTPPPSPVNSVNSNHSNNSNRSNNSMFIDRSPEQISLIHKQLKKLRKLKIKYFKSFKKYKRTSTRFKVIINSLNALSISSITVALSGFPIIVIATAITVSCSSLLSVIHNTINYEQKTTSAQTSYLQIEDLYNTYNNKILGRNPDYCHILDELNQKLGLILDNSLPVSVSSNDDAQ